MNNRNALETVQGWKTTIYRNLEQALDVAQGLLTTDLEDLMDAVNTVESRIQEAIDELPCDDGIREFVDDLGVELDEYHHMDSVVLLDHELEDKWTLNERELAKYADLTDHLERIVNGLADDGELRFAIIDLIDDFTNSNQDWARKDPGDRADDGRYLSRIGQILEARPSLTAKDMPILLNRVALGAGFLDRHFPGWFTKINPVTLDLGSGTRCVLGQLNEHDVVGDHADATQLGRHGSFSRAVTSLSLTGWDDTRDLDDVTSTWVFRHGFNIESRVDRLDFPFNDSATYTDLYDALDDLWKDEVAQRRADTQAMLDRAVMAGVAVTTQVVDPAKAVDAVREALLPGFGTKTRISVNRPGISGGTATVQAHFEDMSALAVGTVQ